MFIQRTRALNFFPTPKEAWETTKVVLLKLELVNFAHTVQMTYDVADVYGVIVEENGWYLKITIDEQDSELVVISFHPLERPLRTRSGEVKP